MTKLLLVLTLALLFDPTEQRVAFADAPPDASAALDAAEASSELDPNAAPAVPAPTKGAVAIADPSKDPGGFLRDLVVAIQSKNLRYLAILGLVGLTWGARQLPIAWFKTDRGGAALAIVVGISGTCAAALAGDVPVGWWTLLDGVANGVSAAGGFVVVKRLLSPPDQRLRAAVAELGEDGGPFVKTRL